MSRHQRNNTASAFFTYHEKKEAGFGTKRTRAHRDSIKTFDACCICLNTVKEPLTCKGGHLFCKSCIYEYMVAERVAIKKRMVLYKKQLKDAKQKIVEKEQAEKGAEIKKFYDREKGAVTSEGLDSQPGVYVLADGGEGLTNRSKAEAVLNVKGRGRLTNFWIPQNTPSAEIKMAKPQTKVLCPEGREHIRAKDLVPVIFDYLHLKNDEKQMSQSENERYQCPGCTKNLTNARKWAVLGCGHAACEECVKTLVVPALACCVCDKPVDKKAVIKMQFGGTGFAAHGEKLALEKKDAVGWF